MDTRAKLTMVKVQCFLRTPAAIETSKQLYKHLMKECRKLPQDSQTYYRHYIRQGFNQHTEETDPERITQIINRAIEDGKWIVKKYSKVQE